MAIGDWLLDEADEHALDHVGPRVDLLVGVVLQVAEVTGEKQSYLPEPPTAIAKS